MLRATFYDGQGYWLAQKRLSKGRFTWWPESTSAAKQLEAYEAQLLMVAGDVSRVRAAPMWRRGFWCKWSRPVGYIGLWRVEDQR